VNSARDFYFICRREVFWREVCRSIAGVHSAELGDKSGQLSGCLTVKTKFIKLFSLKHNFML
jgi:hypothetical protein